MPDTSDVLELFLATQQAEGRYFDTGSFTIDSVKAMQKLSLSQLPHSGLWLVKLVQAAVAGGADSISITFGRRLVKVAFTPSQLWRADQVLETVLSGTLPQERALMHLVTGIRASTAGVTETVTWSCGGARVSLSNDACEIADEPETSEFRLEATRPSRARSLSHRLASSVSQLAKQTVEEYDAVRQHCWVCPIPVVVDGQKLETGYDVVEGGRLPETPFQVLARYDNERHALCACLGIRPLAATSLSSPEIPYLLTPLLTPREKEAGGEIAIHSPVFWGQRFMSWPPLIGERPRAVVALLSGATAAHSKVDFVLDGAVVDSHPLEAWLLPPPKRIFARSLRARHLVGVRLLAGVEARDLDLTQFKVRQPDLATLMDLAAAPLLEMIEAVSLNLGSFYYLPIRRQQLPLTGAAVSLLITAASQGLMLLPAASMIAGVATLNTAVWRGQAKKAMARLASQVSGKIDL